MRGEYLIIEALVFVVVYCLDRYLKLRVFARKRLLLFGVIASIVIFGAWDVYALLNMHWGFNDAFMIGHLWIFPIEEILLIILLIPYVPVVVWECGKRVCGDV